PLSHERGHVENGPHRDRRDAERHHRGGMIVHDRVHIRTRPEDFAVNEALAHRLSSPRIDRIAVEIVLHDVFGHHQFRRKRARVPPAGTNPCLASNSRISGCFSNAFTPAFSFEMTAPAVPAGANMPYQVSTSRSASPNSLSVGTSGNAGERSELITASMRSFPLWTYGATVCSDTIMAWTCPPTRSASAPPDPLYGTCTRSMRASSLSSSMA